MGISNLRFIIKNIAWQIRMNLLFLFNFKALNKWNWE